MAKRKHRGDAPIQRGFDFAAPAPRADAPAKPRRRRVTRAPQATVGVERLDVAALREAWSEANRAVCRTGEHLLRVAGIRLAMLAGDFGVPNDPVTFDWHGRLVNGRKMVQAALELDFPLEVPVARGVNPRSRYAIDDATPRTKQRNASRRTPVVAPPIPLRLDEIPPRDRPDVGRMLDLLARLTHAAGLAGVARPSAGEALGSLALAQAVLVLPQVPTELLALVHLFAARLDAGPAPGDFMRALADPGRAPGSAPALLVRSGNRPARIEDERDFLLSCIVAWGMFRAGRHGDPYAYREALDPRPDAGKLLGAFLRGHQPVPVDASAVAWGVETFDPPEIAALLAASGYPVEACSEEDKARLTTLTTDAHHAGGLRLSGQAVKIRTDGTVEDGIWRLMASHLADKPLRTVVGRGFPTGWSSQLQQGRRQSYGHRNNSEGVSNPYDVSSAVKTLACYEADRRDIDIGLERHRIIHARYPTLMRYSVLARDIEKMVPGKVSTAALALVATRSRSGAEAFYRDLYAAVAETLRPDTRRHRVVLALRQALLGAQRDYQEAAEGEDDRRDSANHAADREQLKKFEWMLLAWNAWIRDREPPDFPEPAEEKFPEVAYPPGDAAG